MLLLNYQDSDEQQSYVECQTQIPLHPSDINDEDDIIITITVIGGHEERLSELIYSVLYCIPL